MIRRKRYRPACSCPGNSGIITAPPAPKLIPKGRYGISIWTQVLLDKFLFFRASHRLIVHVTEARYERDYIVYLKFDDGAERFVELAEELYGEMFEPLKDIGLFRSVRLDPELRTIACANGADFAPEFLHDRLLVPAEQGDQADHQ